MGDDGVWRVKGLVYYTRDLGPDRAIGRKSYLVLAANYKDALEKVTAKLKPNNIYIGQLLSIELLGTLI